LDKIGLALQAGAPTIAAKGIIISNFGNIDETNASSHISPFMNSKFSLEQQSKSEF
jgi:hypothetical protein